MGIWFRKDNGEFAYTDIAEFKIYHECLQELLLWKYENSFYFDNGIDYYSILNKKAFINLEFENVLDKYREYFNEITAEYNNTNLQELQVNIKFVFKDNTIINKNFDFVFKG